MFDLEDPRPYDSSPSFDNDYGIDLTKPTEAGLLLDDPQTPDLLTQQDIIGHSAEEVAEELTRTVQHPQKGPTKPSRLHVERLEDR